MMSVNFSTTINDVSIKKGHCTSPPQAIYCRHAPISLLLDLERKWRQPAIKKVINTF